MRSAENRIVWVFLGLSLVAFGGALLYRWADRTGKFDLDTIRITGIRDVDSACVAEMVAPLFGRTLGSLDRHVLEAELEKIAGIESADVSLIWPGTIRIRAILSRPVLLLCDTTGDYPVSDRCEILQPSFLSDTLPVVMLAGKYDSAGVERIVDWLSDGLPDIRTGHLVLDGKIVSIQLNDYRTVILGERDLEEKWNTFLSVESCALLSGDWSEMDLRYNNQAILRYGSGNE